MKKIALNTHKQNPVNDTLLKALRWLCQPLVKLLINKGVTYPVFCELLKSVYVESARNHLKSKNAAPSFSRIFINTGINRKEIKRIVEEVLSNDEENESVGRSASLGALLVSRWTGLPEYLDKNGVPRKLARISDNSKEPGFNDLLASVNKDIRPRALLDEWLDREIVSIDTNDRVCLNENAFVPKSGFDEKVYFFGKNVSDHIDSCVHNLTSDKPPMLERSVFYSSLSEDSIRSLQAIANQKILEAVDLINKKALSLKSNEKNQENAKFRFRFGCYWFDNTGTHSSKVSKK